MRQPSGTVTLVFTDIEGSTRLLGELGEDAYREALARHRRVVRETFGRFGGYEVDYEGDAFFYAFEDASAAVAGVREAMNALASGPIRIRVGVHTGTPGMDPPKYVGMDVHLAARVMGAGHGGQVLLSKAAREQVDGELLDLGEHRLKDFAEPVWLFQLGSERFPPLKTISNTNLPRPASSFVGREREMAEVAALLRDGARLVTLSGPGGSGKTRLAIEAAAELVPEFKSGVFWVGFTTLRDPALVTETIAQTLGAKDGLAEHIADRELLLLLDNLEQVIAAAPELATLLEASPNLRLLVTSRELLRVRGEREYPVPPLAEREAVELFWERSQLLADDTIAELCRRLDNLPLPVELAAARTSSLSPAQILERLSQRLDLLKGGRDADPRQVTLRATIEWSYELLSKDEQRLFRHLAVFAGGCSLEAAEQVAHADLDTLQSLVDKSLLRFTHERFWMLETIRAYGLERLHESSESSIVSLRHTELFLELAEAAERGLDTPDRAAWLEQLEQERGNLRAALDFAQVTDEPELELRLATALRHFWSTRGPVAEGLRRLEGAVARAGNRLPERRLETLKIAALSALDVRDYGTAERLGQAFLQLARARGDVGNEISSLIKLSHAAAGSGDIGRATSLMEEAVTRAREAGDAEGEARALLNLGVLAANAGDFATTVRLSQECLDVGAESLSDQLKAIALNNLGSAWVELGDHKRGLACLREALAMSRQLGDVVLSAEALQEIATAVSGGDAASGARLLGAAHVLLETVGGDSRRSGARKGMRGDGEGDVRARVRAGPWDGLR